MKLNNKGMTLIEIIISIALISIVLIFIFSLLITVNEMNEKSEANNTYLLSKAMVIKFIEEDIKGATSITLGRCEKDSSTGVSVFLGSYSSQTFDNNKQKASMCIEFSYNKAGVGQPYTSYLALYYKDNIDPSKKVFNISYISEDNPATEENEDSINSTESFPNFEENNINNSSEFMNPPTIIYSDGTDKKTISLTSTSSGLKEYYLASPSTFTNNYFIIKIPIIGDDGLDYTMYIPFHPTT